MVVALIFSYLFTAMARFKLSDRFEFPLELDLKPFTKDALAGIESAQEFHYKLSGILIHSCVLFLIQTFAVISTDSLSLSFH